MSAKLVIPPGHWPTFWIPPKLFEYLPQYTEVEWPGWTCVIREYGNDALESPIMELVNRIPSLLL
jgi:hypothetical protein